MERLVIWSYLQDKSWFKKRKAAHPKFDSVVSDMPETPDLEMHGIEEESDHRAYRKAISAEVDNIHLTKREMRSLMQHVSLRCFLWKFCRSHTSNIGFRR